MAPSPDRTCCADYDEHNDQNYPRQKRDHSRKYVYQLGQASLSEGRRSHDYRADSNNCDRHNPPARGLRLLVSPIEPAANQPPLHEDSKS